MSNQTRNMTLKIACIMAHTRSLCCVSAPNGCFAGTSVVQ